MQNELDTEKANVEWESKREDAKRKDDEKTDKNRKKREKRKAAKAKGGGGGQHYQNGGGGGGGATSNMEVDGQIKGVSTSTSTSTADGGKSSRKEDLNHPETEQTQVEEGLGVVIHDE